MPTLRIVLSFFMVLLLTGCTKENTPPVCQVLLPAAEAEFEAGEAVNISVYADDADGEIVEIVIFIDNVEVGSGNHSPLNYQWNTTGEEEGSRTIRVTAKDDDGAMAEDQVTIEILVAGANTVTDFDGNTYTTIRIGSQRWMSENLRTTRYADGTGIPVVDSKEAWARIGDGDKALLYTDYSSANGEVYGALYTWAAAMKGASSSDLNPSRIKGVCPDGWHIPSDEEWKELERYLGMSVRNSEDLNFRGTDQGSRLAGNAGMWDEGDLTSDPDFGSSGFSAIPSGYVFKDGVFYYSGTGASFWSATAVTDSTSFQRFLEYNDTRVFRGATARSAGLSVRCVKD